MQLVRPTQTFNSTSKANPNGVVLSPADILRDDNPHVRARPEMFEPIRETVDRVDDIEEATNRPGEKRNR